MNRRSFLKSTIALAVSAAFPAIPVRSDRDFWDGVQWEPWEIEDLMKRGYTPLEINMIWPVMNRPQGPYILP